METIAYTHLQSAYDEATGVEYELPQWGVNIPSSAWLRVAGIAVLLATLAPIAPASAVRVNTPSGGCLNARYGPGTGYGAYTCVSDGAALKPVIARRGSWIQLSSGGWVYAPYTTASRVNVGGGGGGGSPYRSYLTPGAQGRAVRTLQSSLAGSGYYYGAVDGIYGPRTTSAVRRYQRSAGLRVDGIAGPRTMARLYG
jgi:hypothetical protein